MMLSTKMWSVDCGSAEKCNSIGSAIFLDVLYAAHYLYYIFCRQHNTLNILYICSHFFSRCEQVSCSGKKLD